MKSLDGQVMESVTTRQITLNAILMEVTAVVQKLLLHTVLNVFVTGLFVVTGVCVCFQLLHGLFYDRSAYKSWSL